ncbi:MAG: hypothetical protein N2204_08040 [Anaerolineae bacterium]|nr:hypothetical protein [Anaerolineae bacterium]
MVNWERFIPTDFEYDFEHDELAAHHITFRTLSESEIDQIVIAQADDDAAWEPSIHVERSEPASLLLPGDLAARAAFLARLHRTKSVEEWLTRVIQDRIEFEEAVFIGIKEGLAAKAP